MSPTRSGHAMRRALAVLATASLAALALGAGLALAAPPGSVSEAEIQAALQRDLHLSAQEVKKQGALQARASSRDAQLRESLG